MFKIIKDDIYIFLRDNWEHYGFAPIFLKMLITEYDWQPDEIDEVFRRYIGEDYQLVNGTVWVARLEAWGHKFPDGKPVIVVLDEILKEAYEIHGGLKFLH